MQKKQNFILDVINRCPALVCVCVYVF